MKQKNYESLSWSQLVAERRTIEAELKTMGHKFTLLPLGSEERDFYGCQITGLYAQLGSVNNALKAINYAH